MTNLNIKTAEVSSLQTAIHTKSSLDVSEPQGQTDSANSVRFIDLYHSELLYIPPWRKWLSWDGQRWAKDNGIGVMQRAKQYADSLWANTRERAEKLKRDEFAKVVTFNKRTNQATSIKSMLELASCDERIVCPVDELNADPRLLNVSNGTIDLTTGKILPHNPADRITQLAPVLYDPNAKCTNWVKSLELYFDGDPGLIRYVQQLLGYSISGDTGEHILPIAYGNGCNGKSTIWNVITGVLGGDYATLASDTLLLGQKGNHPTEKAALYQKRFVALSEPEKRSYLKESRVKELTGDSLITARGMKEDFWTFKRTHTFWLSTNHLPQIGGTDDGIWRRVKVIPFNVDIRDKVTPVPDFENRLIQHEGPAILAWLVQGYLDYLENGFVEPSSVTQATLAYRDDSDVLGDYVAQHCIVDDSGVFPAKEAFLIYKDVYKGTWSQTHFGKEMTERFRKYRPTSGEYRHKVVYTGVRLRDDMDVIDE